MTSVKKWKKPGPHTQSIYFCKEDSNIISKLFKEFRCKSSKYQESFKLPRQENELFSHNHSVKEYQIAVKNTARHVKYKKKSDSEGETFFSKNTEVLSTVSEMFLDISDENFSFEDRPVDTKFSSKEESAFN